MEMIQVTIFAVCEFIAQFILVRTTGNAYHLSNSSKDISLLDCLELRHLCCGRSFSHGIHNLRSIDLSSLSDFNLWSLGLWIVPVAIPAPIVQGRLTVSDTLAGGGNFPLSMVLIAVVTALIVFKILKVFRKTSTADSQILQVTGGSTFRRVIFIIIESAMALFLTQLARFVVTMVEMECRSLGCLCPHRWYS